MRYDLSNKLDRMKAQTRLGVLSENKKQVEIKEVRQKRSITQNSYLHKVITLFGIGFGYTLDESKTLLKRNCPFMRYEKNGIVFLKQTSEMDSKELTDFIEWIRNYSASEGVYIPTSEEYLKNQYRIDKEISANQVYM